jgi:hypothetical protein
LNFLGKPEEIFPEKKFQDFLFIGSPPKKPGRTFFRSGDRGF